MEDPSTPAARAKMVAALRGTNAFLVAVVADALESADHEWVQLLTAAFDRFLQDPVKRDPSCRAKIAIAKALYRTEVDGDEVYLAGAHHVQLESVWKAKVDTAAELRGVCVMGLVFREHPRAMVEAARLLADPERAARIGAAQAIGASGKPEIGEPLLRLRVELPEPEADVFGAYLGAMLELAPRESLALVSRHLNVTDEEHADAAALALGSSRAEGAFELLRNATESRVASRSSVLLLSIALLRTDEAWSYLVELVATADGPHAKGALSALSTFKHDTGLVERVREVVDARGDDALAHAYVEHFEDAPPAQG